MAQEMDKQVVLSYQLEQKLQVEFSRASLNSNNFDNPVEDRLYEIGCPVITVLSSGKRTDQFATELAIRGYFIEAGYSISQIGSNSASQFFGFSDAPKFLYNSQDAYTKVLNFNQHLRNLTTQEQPDLLILGVPEAIMKHDDQLLNGLGVLPFIVCNSVKSDLGILCMHYGAYNEQFFSEMSKFCQYRLNSPISLINMSNVSASQDASDNTKLNYTDLDSSFVLCNISKIEIDDYLLFSALNQQSADEACRKVHSILTDNVHYMR